jgi:hypothetical protein
MSKKSRRQFLQEMGAFSSGAAFLNSPLGLFLSSIIGSALTRNMALAQGINPRRYVNIQNATAPPRWMFDLMINAYGTANTLALGNGMLGTRYVANGGRYTDVEYRTVLLNGIRVPWIWQYNVPKAGGGTRPMKDLIPNMLVLQGITTGNPGHPGSQSLHFRPAGATRTLGALSADFSNAYIPAINLTAQSFLFVSLKGKSAVPVPSNGNMLQTLLNPFLSQASQSFKDMRNNVNLKAALNDARTAMDSVAQSDHLSANALIESQKSAEQLINGGFGDLATQWSTLLAKYEDIVQRAIKAVIPGINDLPVGDATPATRGKTYDLTDQTVKFADLRELMNSATLGVSRLAQQFAITEYVLKNDLSYSVTMSPGSMIGMKTGAGLNTIANHGVDEHSTGKMPSLLINSLVYMAYAGCMLELIDQLKTKGIWDDTLIDMGGEFNRSARVDGTGSDHGYLGKSVALYSGGFNGPLVVGNIRAQTGSSAWGMGATVTQLGRQLQMNDMAATISYLLRTPSPITSATSLVTVNATTGVITANVEKARRV